MHIHLLIAIILLLPTALMAETNDENKQQIIVQNQCAESIKMTSDNAFCQASIVPTADGYAVAKKSADGSYCQYLAVIKARGLLGRDHKGNDKENVTIYRQHLTAVQKPILHCDRNPIRPNLRLISCDCKSR